MLWFTHGSCVLGFGSYLLWCDPLTRDLVTQPMCDVVDATAKQRCVGKEEKLSSANNCPTTAAAPTIWKLKCFFLERLIIALFHPFRIPLFHPFHCFTQSIGLRSFSVKQSSITMGAAPEMQTLESNKWKTHLFQGMFWKSMVVPRNSWLYYSMRYKRYQQKSIHGCWSKTGRDTGPYPPMVVKAKFEVIYFRKVFRKNHPWYMVLSQNQNADPEGLNLNWWHLSIHAISICGGSGKILGDTGSFISEKGL